MNKLVKSVSRTDLKQEFLKSLNGILGLTERELDLLVTLIDVDQSNLNVEDGVKDVTNTANRKHVMNTTGITADNLSRYIKRFKEKGILVKGKYSGSTVVNPALIPDLIGNKTVQITIILKVI